MTYLDIAAKVLRRDQDPVAYRELVHAAMVHAPSYFQQCPDHHVQAFEYMFQTILHHVHQMPKHQVTRLIKALTESN